ncbi:MAG: DUF2796 domain-containing protein [Alphaproteobacteria bacterium]|nr:DUF2796 domain-containing protein [Alphaproteobacteria bacterium]
MKTLFASAALAALMSGAAVTQEGETRQLGAHVHGEARLSVAIDPASGLALAELSGAAWNFYGFERAPETDAERETIASVNAALSEPGLIAFPERAGCTLAQTDIAGAGGDHDHNHGHDGDHGHDHEADHDHGHADHEAHGSEHDHGHGHEDHEDHGSDHGHDHGGHDHAEHAHTDIAVSWTYQCERADAASRLDAAGVFTALPRLESVEAEAFDGTRAAVRTLTPDDAVITLD